MNWEDSLQDSKGVNSETDSDGIPEYERNQHIAEPFRSILNSFGGNIEQEVSMADKQDANVGSLLNALKMHNDKLRELSAEVGRSLTVLEAHTYRIRRLKEQLITRMLEEE